MMSNNVRGTGPIQASIAKNIHVDSKQCLYFIDASPANDGNTARCISVSEIYRDTHDPSSLSVAQGIF